MTISIDDPYVKKLMQLGGQALFNELLSSRQRAKVVYVITFKASQIKMKPDKWMALELQREVINRNPKLFKNQEDLYDVLNMPKGGK